MQQIDDILSRLDPKTRKRVALANSVKIERFKTPSLGINAAIGGGLAFGRHSLIWGSKSSAKSAFCLQTVGSLQKEGKTCAWIDVEQSYDPEWAERLGVDSSQLIVSPVKGYDELAEVGMELMKAGVDAMFVDSITPLIPSSFFDDSEMKPGLEGTKQIGTSAKDLGNVLRKFSYVNDHTAIVYISQVRNKFLQNGAMHQHTGGFALDHYISTSIKMMGNSREADQITADFSDGGKIYKRPVGRPINWLIDKNKIGPPLVTGEIDFYYHGDQVGFDTHKEIVTVAIRSGVIKQAASWLSYGDLKLQGDRKFADYLRENNDVYEGIVNELGV